MLQPFAPTVCQNDRFAFHSAWWVASGACCHGWCSVLACPFSGVDHCVLCLHLVLDMSLGMDHDLEHEQTTCQGLFEQITDDLTYEVFRAAVNDNDMAPDMEVLCWLFDAVSCTQLRATKGSGRCSSGTCKGGVPLLPEPPLRFIGYLDVVLLAPSRVGAVAVVAHLLRLSSPCSIPNMGV